VDATAVLEESFLRVAFDQLTPGGKKRPRAVAGACPERPLSTGMANGDVATGMPEAVREIISPL
jgi:hypothetical protein